MEFHAGESFWETHPTMTAAGPFGAMYKKDKTRGKDHSSRLAWCIVLIWDRKSIYYALPEDGEDSKIDLVFDEYYGDEKYYKKNKEKIDELRDFYRKVTETIAMRTLRGIEEKLMERDAFLKNTPYDLGEKGERGYLWGTVDIVDKMMANTNKVYELLDKARKAVSDEMAQSVMGDKTQSLSDTGEI